MLKRERRRGGSSQRTTVLVATDDQTGRRVADALRASPGFTVCAEEETAVGAVASALRDRPDLCLLGLEIPGGSTTAAWEISARLPRTKIVVLTDSHDIPGLTVALAAGVSGFVRTDIGLERLPQVLAKVMEGEMAIPRASVGEIAAEFRHGRARRRSVSIGAQSSRLTSREWEVLDLMCSGSDTAGIARSLHVSPATARSHISGALKKLGLPDRAAALRLLGQT